jgi:hypothetical protein
MRQKEANKYIEGWLSNVRVNVNEVESRKMRRKLVNERVMIWYN